LKQKSYFSTKEEVDQLFKANEKSQAGQFNKEIADNIKLLKERNFISKVEDQLKSLNI